MKHFWSFFILVMLAIAGCKGDTSDKNSTTTQSLEIKQPDKIQLEASQTTVLIAGKNNGTGIIIGRNGSKHYVLTSKHVVGVPPGTDITLPPDPGPDEINLPNREDPYKAIAYNGKKYQEYEIKYETVVKDELLDLAIFTFDTGGIIGEKYPVANLAVSDLSENKAVYIYGFKDCFNKSRKQKEEFTNGVILSVSKNIHDDEGYTIKYSNSTITGMSGSPVFDQAGRVIAIHGKPGKLGKDISYISENCLPLTEDYAKNFGISMDTFKNSSLVSKLPVKLQFDSRDIPSARTGAGGIKNNSGNEVANPPIRFQKPETSN